MLQQKGKYIIVGSVAAVLAVGVVFFAIRRDDKGPAVTPFWEDTAEEAPAGVVMSKVIVQDDDGVVKSVDIASGNIEDATALEREDFSGFSGLPKFGADGQKDLEQDLVLVSKDKSKAIVTVAAYDASQSVSDMSAYVCDIAEKECQPSDILSQPYQGLNASLQKGNGPLWWYAWDSEKGLLFGHLVSESIGDISPVYVCDTGSKACSKTEGFDSEKSGDTRAVVPEGAFSPSLSSFVMIAENDTPNEETGKAWQLLLYSSSDLSKPAKSYDISAAIDHDGSVAYDSVRSVAWSGDGKKIAIGTARRIFVLDTATGGLSLAFVAPPNEDGDAYWDNSALFMTSDAKYIAFTDESGLVDDTESSEDDAVPINTLKRIDLGHANTVSELLQGPGLGIK